MLKDPLSFANREKAGRVTGMCFLNATFRRRLQGAYTGSKKVKTIKN
jgi:hypothetical protein